MTGSDLIHAHERRGARLGDARPVTSLDRQTMSDFQILPGLFLAPTPAGAYDAVSGRASGRARRIILHAMRDRESPALTAENLVRMSGLPTEEAVAYLYRMQSLNLVQGLEAPRSLPAENLETALPRVLADIAGANRALLADAHGFYLASHGFHRETAEELAGLSADIGTLHVRHQGLITGNLSVHTAAWALINAAGNSEIGFWPLVVGDNRFVLILTGLPHLNRPATVDLIWMLVQRYGRTDEA